MPSNDIKKLLKLEKLNFETYEEKEEYMSHVKTMIYSFYFLLLIFVSHF